MKAATTVNKQTGHVNGYIDRRTKADREKHIQHANESSSYKGPDSNNRKAFGKDLSHQITMIKMSNNRKMKITNRIKLAKINHNKNRIMMIVVKVRKAHQKPKLLKIVNKNKINR